jgi:type III secretion protein J
MIALRSLFLVVLFFLGACQRSNHIVINDIDERQANEIIVFLASNGIQAEKIPSPSSAPGGAGGAPLWSIAVEGPRATDAMALLNQNGLPRIKGVDLLELFAKQGFMTSDKEETIRYQAGLAQQIANVIRKIDGVIDADVQLSFPPTETTPLIGATAPPQKITAAVYVKHQGILDDPNSHLVTKIKRLVAGSVNGLDANDVTVIPDRSRLTDISLAELKEPLMGSSKDYVSIWSIVMSKHSTGKFRFLFFTLSFFALFFALTTFWILWKFYPLLKEQGGFKVLLNPVPIDRERKVPIKTEKEE